MDPNTIWIISMFLGLIAAAFTMSAAVFTFLDSAQNDKSEDTRKWFMSKWGIINQSRWLHLPENVTRWVLDARTLFSRFIINLIDTKWLRNILVISIPIFLFVVCYISWGISAAFLSLVISFPIFAILKEELLNFIDGNTILEYYFILISTLSGVASAFLCLKIVLSLNIYYAAPAMTLLLPVIWVGVFFPFVAFSETQLDLSRAKEDAIIIFLFGIAAGFTITFLAFLIGHITDPLAYIPQTFQMLVSNVLCDGITMVVTFAILDKALSKPGFFRLPLAILLDCLAGVFLACCSLYAGLVFTAKALTVREVLHVLIGRSLDNTQFELSPYFWAMHTTFLPTLIYLTLIMFCWTGKSMLIPVRWFFGKGQEHKNPLKLAASLCTLFAAIFGVMYFTTNAAYTRAKDSKANQDQIAVPRNTIK